MRYTTRQVTLLLLSLFIAMSGLVLPAQAVVYAEEAATLDTPTALVASGTTRYVVAAPKVFWYTGVPACPPTVAAAAAPAGGSADYTELIRRVATYGSTIRTLYSEGRDCNQGQIGSNLAADAQFLYWIGPNALMKLAVEANPGDAPQLMNALIKGFGAVVNASDRVYTVHFIGNGSYEVNYVLKSNNQRVPLATYPNVVSNLQTDGEYVYYLVNGSLIRLKPGIDSGVTIATGVTGYYPEGQRLTFCTINPFHCFFSNNVYVAKGRQLFLYNNKDNTLGSTPIYTSADTTASIYSLVTDFGKLFAFERRTLPCQTEPCFASYSTVLQRMPRSGGSSDALYTYGPDPFSGPEGLTTDGTFLFWQENESVQRLANDASALPQVNLRVTGMEVTQGIQNLSNSVLLVKNRRTFVRVYVKSDGAAVSGVTARLNAPTLEASVAPVNPIGTQITVRANPDRNDLNQSFLFELPWNWTQQNNLNLRVDLNPYKVPLEPNYSDNSGTATVTFKPSPSLSVEFFRLNYTINSTTYRPRIFDDVLKSYSWILRAYPIGGAIGQNFKPRLWDVDGGTRLGNWVNQSSSDCASVYPKADDRNLCASYYTNGWLFYYRVATQFGLLNVGLKTNAFYYGMISDASNNFPRGQAIYDKTSVGPSGTPGQFFNLGSGWDTDGSYADWYAAHEIGHSLGRAHPNAGSDNPATPNTTENCGHSRSDPGFPYGNTTTARAPIGPADGSMAGFDTGDPTFGIARAVLPSATWNDVMSYCNSQWLSDYTYTGMYNNMIANPSLVAAGTQHMGTVGDFLVLSGVINPDANTVGFAFVRRLANVINVPPLTPGAYSLRLVDGGNTTLADYPFTPEEVDHGIGLGFNQVVNFVAGTRAIQIVQSSTGQILGSSPVSANPPTISNVVLQSASNPVTGTVTLNWTASDPDGDAVTFDIAYSRDNGVTFQPVTLNVTESSVQIDTTQLGGSGAAILRVTVTDGVNSASADSAPFVMANKPPQAYILTPGNNTHVHYGQLVNFSGMAFDVQDGTVADVGLVWKNAQGVVLGTGALLSLDSLPVGANVISLVATNSAGEAVTATVTVIVDDDLNQPGPTLSAGPSPVSWHIGVEENATQTADLSITNAGSGTLNWTTTSNQPWLILSAAQGTVEANGDPVTLTLSANPSGLASGQTHVAQVTIAKPASGNEVEQTIVIPVSLSIGDVWNVAPAAAPVPSQSIYLPLITR